MKGTKQFLWSSNVISVRLTDTNNYFYYRWVCCSCLHVFSSTSIWGKARWRSGLLSWSDFLSEADRLVGRRFVAGFGSVSDSSPVVFMLSDTRGAGARGVITHRATRRRLATSQARCSVVERKLQTLYPMYKWVPAKNKMLKVLPAMYAVTKRAFVLSEEVDTAFPLPT